MIGHFSALFSLLCATANAASDYPSCLPCKPNQILTTSPEKSITDIAYDPVEGKIYTAYWDDDVVDIFNRDGSNHGSIDMQFNTWGSLTSIDIHNGILYGSMQNRVYVRSADLKTHKTSAVFGPYSVYGNSNIIVKDDQILIVNYVANAVVVYDMSGSVVKKITTADLRYPQDAAFDFDGNLHVTGTYNGKIFIFDSSGTFASTYGTNVLKEPFGIFIDDQGNRFIADRKRKDVLVFDGEGYINRTIFASQMSVYEVVLVPSCSMWVTAPRNTILIYRGK